MGTEDTNQDQALPLTAAAMQIMDFQQKIGAPAPHQMNDIPGEIERHIRMAADTLHTVNVRLKALYKQTKSQHVLRAELMTEELEEALCALASCDELALLDALADLAYVVIGTATTFDLPIGLAFQEVHRSNMTKGSTAADHQGDKGKGATFSPPDLARVLRLYRGDE